MSVNLETGMTGSAILTKVDAVLSCWDGILCYIQPEAYEPPKVAKERVTLVPSDCEVIINNVVLLLGINILHHTYY